MKSTIDDFEIPAAANYVRQGHGAPVILVHGVAASLHDWDDLIPELASNGYAAYALDLLGHGESPHPRSRAYRMEWVTGHFMNWVRSLRLTEPAVVIGHSLGGYLALEYARRLSAWTRGLVLVDPFYSASQLPLILRRTYRHPTLSGMIASRLPEWMFRIVVDITSLSMGHGAGALHSLPEHTRAQTALDYTRTAPGVYNLPNVVTDLTEQLPRIYAPTLVIWGDRDQTLSPGSFTRMVNVMPGATGRTLPAGHVPHQSNTREFNDLVLEFIKGLS